MGTRLLEDPTSILLTQEEATRMHVNVALTIDIL